MYDVTADLLFGVWTWGLELRLHHLIRSEFRLIWSGFQLLACGLRACGLESMLQGWVSASGLEREIWVLWYRVGCLWFRVGSLGSMVRDWVLESGVYGSRLGVEVGGGWQRLGWGLLIFRVSGSRLGF